MRRPWKSWSNSPTSSVGPAAAGAVAHRLRARRRALEILPREVAGRRGADQGARRRHAQAVGERVSPVAWLQAWNSFRPGSLGRPQATARRAGLVRPGCRCMRRPASARPCAMPCSTAASACGRCWCSPPARPSAARGGRAARRLRGRADPRLFAGARRHALHGQRRTCGAASPPCTSSSARPRRLLAGDALQALAFEVLAPDDAGIPAACRRRLCRLLARAAGQRAWPAARRSTSPASGSSSTEAQLRGMHSLKTGALLERSVMMGAACGDTPSVPRWPPCGVSGRRWGWRSRWSTTSSTSPPTRRRWARPPARTRPRTNRPTSRCWAWTVRGPMRQELLAQARTRSATSGLRDTQALRALAIMVVNRDN